MPSLYMLSTFFTDTVDHSRDESMGAAVKRALATLTAAELIALRDSAALLARCTERYLPAEVK